MTWSSIMKLRKQWKANLNLNEKKKIFMSDISSFLTTKIHLSCLSLSESVRVPLKLTIAALIYYLSLKSGIWNLKKILRLWFKEMSRAKVSWHVILFPYARHLEIFELWSFARSARLSRSSLNPIIFTRWFGNLKKNCNLQICETW